MAKIRCTLMTGMLFLLIGEILAIVSLASEEWLVFPGGLTNGLWRSCPPNDDCVKITKTDDIQAVQAMMLLCVIVAGVALITVIVELAYGAAKKVTSRWTTRFVCAFTFLAAIFALIGVCVYAARIYHKLDSSLDADYGYSFWLGVVALILFVIAACFFLASAIYYAQARARRKKMEKQQLYQRDIQYGVITRNPPMKEGYYGHQRGYQGNYYTHSPVVYPYSAYGHQPGYLVHAPTPFNIYSHGDSGRVNSSGYQSPVSKSRRGDHRYTQSNAASGYGRSTKSYLGNTVVQEEVYGQSARNMGASNRPSMYGQSTKNYLEVPGNGRGRSHNNYGNSVYSITNDARYGYGASRASSKVDRDEYGYPRNYQRDL